jgi:hypothetical protein
MAKNTALLSLLRRPVENKTDADSAQQAANGQKADAPTSPPESERNSERNRVKILLEQAWKLHDRALSRDGKMAWSPVDYAPHLWREFEGLLLGYESRYRGGKTFDENKLAEGLSTDLVPLKELLEHAEHAERADRGASAWVGVESTVVDRLAKAQQQFLNGPARTYEKEQEEVSALRTAVQLKNDLLFRAPYYLRWREHVARSSQQPTRLDEPIAKLLKELKEYLVLLSPLNEEKLAGKTTGDLQVLREALGQKKIVLEKLRDTIERVELEKVFMEVIADPGKEGNAGKIEGLLSTPLLPAPERIRLLSALDSPGKAGQMGTLDSPTKFQAVEPSIAQWQRDRLEEQAELEVLLVQLVDSQFAVGDRPSGQDTGQENPQSVEFWQKNRVLGKRLGDFYQDLPEKINGLIDSGDRSKSHFLDRLLLVVDARDAGEIKKEATLAAFRPLQLPLTPIPEPPKKPEFDAGPMKPDRIDLQVRRVFAADVGSTEPWMKENSLLRLRPFPNRTTSYCFELVNRSPREKTVEVKLYALTTSPEKQSQAWQKLLDAKGNTGDLPRAIFRPLLPKPVEMKLPSDPAPKAIPFPEPKSEKPAKPEKEAPKSEPAKDKEAEFQSLPEIPYPYVLVCVIRDTVEKGQKWVKQIELAPQKPSEYLEPEVNYDFQRGRITIDVRPRSEFLPPFSEEDPIYAPLSEEAPIRIVWRTEKEFGADTPLKNKAKITSADQTPQLFAGVGPDVRRVVEVSLDVDDYPRAFVYKVPLDRKRSKIPQERDLRHIQIFSPEDNLAYRSPLDPLGPPIVVEFQVDAPEDAFQEPGERVELTVLDADHDRELCPDEKRPFFGDRQVDLRLAGVNLQGEVKIATKVTDFKVPVGKRGLEGLTNIKARFRAQLYLHHRVAAGSPPMVSDVQVVFDGSPPKLGPLVVPSATVAQGDMLNASIDVQDDFSGVKEIQYGFDFDDSGKFEKEKGEKPETLSLPDRDGTWRFSLPTKDLKPGRYAVLVIATDRVGNSNSAKEYVTIEQPLPPPPPLEAKKTSTIKGRVVSGEGEPISGASVTLEGSSFSGTSDNDGRFTFKDVPHGNYKILTRGAVKNKEVSNSMEITLPASEEPAQVKIVLKW